jgi:hypothetical protein
MVGRGQTSVEKEESSMTQSVAPLILPARQRTVEETNAARQRGQRTALFRGAVTTRNLPLPCLALPLIIPVLLAEMNGRLNRD